MEISRDFPLSRTRMSGGVCHRVFDRLSIGQKQRQQQRRFRTAGRGARTTIACSRCHTAFVVPRRRAHATAAAIGAVAGAIQGASTALAETDAQGCSSHPLGVIAGAILGGLLGGAAGGVARSAIGALPPFSTTE